MRKSLQVADAELWEDLIHVAKDIVHNSISAEKILSNNFICRHWPIKKIKINHESWHQIPHIGQIHQDLPKNGR